MGIAAGNETWAMNFCNIIDLKLFQIYILEIININTREIIWQAITIHPNREWIDSIMVEYFEIEVLRITSRCPWQNGVIERYWKSLQEELICRLHIQNESSLRYFCNKYEIYYNEIRPHQGILGKIPGQMNKAKSLIQDLSSIKYQKIKHAHGLFFEFKIAA